MIVSNTAIRNRTSVFLLILLIGVAGAYSYVTLPREAAPDVPIPYVLVSTSYEGVSPEDVESSVTMKLEKELTGLKGVKEISSTSAEGLSVIVIEFLPDVLVEDALQYVREKVDLAKAELPSGAEEPVIKEINVAEFPIIIVNVSGPISPVRLKFIADQLEDAIENVPGVLNVDVLGGLEREIRLEIDQDRLAAYGLTIPELLTLIPSENVNISAGGLETAVVRFNVRVPGEFSEPEDIDHLLLAIRDGRPIYLVDVARVCDTFKDRASYARLDGADSITLSIQKRVGANVVVIAEAVKRILAEAQRIAPAGVKFDVTMDQSKDIRMMVKDLENNVLSGLVLVVLVLVLFLGFRTSAIVALAIPVSMLMSLALLQAMGYTLNMIVLFSLILALGMLVDNAIVIVENIFRHRQLGYGRIEAAMKGTSEVAWPVITSTATTIAAFSPLLFWPGIIGDFMKYLPVTVITALSSSLFVAIVISPTVCSVFGGEARRGRDHHPILNGYRRLLGASLRHWPVALSLAVLLLVALFITYNMWGHGVELFPKFDPRRAYINIRSPQGTNIAESDRLAAIVEQRVQRYRSDLKHVVTNVGSAGGFSLTGAAGGPHMANLTLVFHDYEERPRPSENVVTEIRKDLADIAGAEIKVEKEKEGPPTGAAITVRIIGEDFKTLEQLSEKAKPLIADVPGLVNLRSDLEATRPELVFRVDRRRAMLLGVNSMVIGNFLKTAVFGSKVSTYRQFNDEYDITVRLPVSQREDIRDVLRLRVPNSQGRAVPLTSLGEFDYRGGFGTIHRISQKRVVTLTGDAEGRLGPAVLKDVQARLDELGYSPLLARDVQDWAGFCRLLRDCGARNTPHPGRRVWHLLDGKTRQAVGELAALSTLDPAEKNQQKVLLRVLGGLNRLLNLRDLYRAEDFEGVQLPQEAAGYLARPGKSLSDKEVQRLNRVLLESAFPGVLAKRQRLELPPGYRLQYAGEKEEEEKAQAFLTKAFVFALLLIVIILVMQFNTFSAPLIIMTTVGLPSIGVLVGLLVCRMPFSIIMTGVGVISLAGVVVNNAIVLMAYTRQLQRRGMDIMSAAVQAGATRLRPVLLTATTTILGLVPMATGASFDFHILKFVTRSESSQFWGSMAVAVIFGLGFATMLTLLVVPTLYVTLYRLARRFGLGGLRKPAGEEVETAPPQLVEG